jgi:hypothetical protein
MFEHGIEMLLVLLLAGVGWIVILLERSVKHLEKIGRILGVVIDGRMEPDIFIDRMHRITLGATESAEYLKSIEARMDQFTLDPDDQKLVNIIGEMARRAEANREKND